MSPDEHPHGLDTASSVEHENLSMSYWITMSYEQLVSTHIPIYASYYASTTEEIDNH